MILKNCLYCQSSIESLYNIDGRFFRCKNTNCQKYNVNYQKESYKSNNVVDVAIKIDPDYTLIQELIFPLLTTFCYKGSILKKNKVFSFEAKKILSITEMVNKFNNLIALL